MDCGLACAPTLRRAKKTLSGRQQPEPTIEHDAREWPVDPGAYDILEQAGQGGNATVYKAFCRPLQTVVAIKILDLNGCTDLGAVAREAQLMRRYSHNNVLPLYTSMVHGSQLWMVSPFMSCGSARSIMKRDFPDGLNEGVLATIMKEALKGLAYVHANNGIHRDVKADNILLGEDGSVMLADFGVAAVMRRNESCINLRLDAAALLRTTVIGTPCWMAPEVLADVDGYDSSADMWSFGITLLELAQGTVPLARQHPMRVVMSTVSGPAPTLEDNARGGRSYSKALKQVVSLCLCKDPCERVRAAELLEHRFFKQARDKDFLVQYFLAGLSPAGSPRAVLPGLRPASPAEGLLGGGSAFMARLASNWFFPPTGTATSSAAASARSSFDGRQPAIGPDAAAAAAAAAAGGGPRAAAAPSGAWEGAAPARPQQRRDLPAPLHEDPAEEEAEEAAASAAADQVLPVAEGGPPCAGRGGGQGQVVARVTMPVSTASAIDHSVPLKLQARQALAP